jgi:hypothetical protein
MLMRHFNLMDKYISQSVNIYRTWISNVICRIRMSEIVKQYIYMLILSSYKLVVKNELSIKQSLEKRHMNRDLLNICSIYYFVYLSQILSTVYKTIAELI